MGLLDKLGTVAAWTVRDFLSKKSDKLLRSLPETPNTPNAQEESPAFEHCVLSRAQVEDLRSLYASAKGVCSLIDQSDICDTLGYPGHTLEEMFENDAIRYSLYLSAKDGELTKAEAEFMNVVFNCERTVGEWTIRAIRLGVTSPAMATDVPLSFQVLNQVSSRCGIDVRDVILPVVDRLGSALMVADGEETVEEQECAGAYLALLTGYLDSGESELTPPAYPIFLS